MVRTLAYGTETRSLLMIGLTNKKALLLSITLLLIGTLTMVNVPRVQAVGTGTGGVALSALSSAPTDTTLAGVTVKTDTHIKFSNSTTAQTTWNPAGTR